MRVAGFTFVRNAVKYDYPVREAILSVLPLCEYFVVVVGKGDDNTLDVVKSINSSRIEVFETWWNDHIREGGRALGIEATKALLCIPPNFDWIVYIQADEALHEDDFPTIKKAMEENLENPLVEGLALEIVPFYASYRWVTISPSWNFHMVRIFKPVPGIHIGGDGNNPGVFERKIRARVINARLFHYGWVRPPHVIQQKREYFEKLWHDDIRAHQLAMEPPFKPLPLKEYTGTHPAPFKERIASFKEPEIIPTRSPTLVEKIRLKLRKFLGRDIFGYRGFIQV